MASANGDFLGPGNNRRIGTIIIDGHEAGCTLQCAHCGNHWVLVKGSGRVRGYCMDCSGPTCGSRACTRPVPHVSWLKKLELHRSNPQRYPL